MLLRSVRAFRGSPASPLPMRPLLSGVALLVSSGAGLTSTMTLSLTYLVLLLIPPHLSGPGGTPCGL